jgi:tetratricopeptide (TPR) repeat protein
MQKVLGMRQDSGELTQKERENLALFRSHVHENLGILYKNESKYEPAFDHLKTTLEFREKYLPRNHYSIAQTYNNLRLVLTAIGNQNMALEYTNKARTIQNESLLEKHPHLATMYQTETNALYHQGKYSEAFTRFEKAYNIYRSIPHCDPLLEASALSNIGSTLNVMGKYDQALDYFIKALEVQRCIAPNHSNMI